MAKPSRRRESKDEKMRTRPTLQAFVICERVDTHQDGVHSLYRVVDRFNIRLQWRGPAGVPPPVPPGVPVNYVLFARFGAGVGRFRASFELFDPDADSLQITPDDWFWLRTREQSHNVVVSVSMPVAKSGPYKWVARLDGEPVGEYVFATQLETFASSV